MKCRDGWEDVGVCGVVGNVVYTRKLSIHWVFA